MAIKIFQQFVAKNFTALLNLSGFSDELLRNHFTLYEGYVKNFNELNNSILELKKRDQFLTPAYAEMNRRFGWEFNGMRLHEYYFENLSKEKSELGLESPLRKKIEEEFGSLESFAKDFKSMAAMRGIGWVILYYDQQNDRLFNVWINEHDTGHFAGCHPLLVGDFFEHAYMIDYGTKKADYIESFWKNIFWKKVEERFTT